MHLAVALLGRVHTWHGQGTLIGMGPHTSDPHQVTLVMGTLPAPPPPPTHTHTYTYSCHPPIPHSLTPPPPPHVLTMSWFPSPASAACYFLQVLTMECLPATACYCLQVLTMEWVHGERLRSASAAVDEESSPPSPSSSASPTSGGNGGGGGSRKDLALVEVRGSHH